MSKILKKKGFSIFLASVTVFFVALTVTSFAPASAEAAQNAYVTCNSVPWSETTNEGAMDMAFGAGNWDALRFETVNAGTLLSSGYRFIYMDGGDECADIMEGFLTANSAAISSWVNGGGALFLNSAPNVGDGMSFGFGVTLTYQDFGTSATAVTPTHPIFLGPFTPVVTSYTGIAFAHATVSGGGITSVINNENSRSVLAQLKVGSGFVMFGGMTTDNYQFPQPESHNLRANILSFAASQGSVPSVPAMNEWGMIVFVLLAGFVSVCYLRKKTARAD